MSLNFSSKVAFRYLWARRGEAFITIITLISILGVAIGVMVINVVMSVMTGFESELKDKIVGTNSHIVVRTFNGKMPEYKKAVSDIQSIPGVVTVSPFTYHQALLRSEDRATGILVRGVDRGGISQVAKYLDSEDVIESLFSPPPVSVVTERGEEEAKLPGILVGKELYKMLGLFIGSPITLISPSVSSTPFGLMPKLKRFVVVGVYSSGLVEYESGLAYASLEEAQKFFQMGDAVSGLEVRVSNIDDSPAIAKAIVDKLGGLTSGFYAQDWTQTNKPLWDALRLEKKVYFIVLLLIIVMASFSIITTLIMIVLEKKKDIAIMRTMGASAKSIANIFRIQGGVIGAIGTLLGLILGYLACITLQIFPFGIEEKIFQMSTLPVRIEFFNFALVGVCAFLICWLATIYPAMRASRLEPSDVLRYE